MELVAAFRSDATAVPGADTELEARLAALVARGQAAHPGLALDGVTFVRHLARCLSGAGAEAAALEALEIEDLYLACACLAGVTGAAARFEERCDARLRAVLAAVAKSPDLRAEVQQRVMDILLVGTVDGPPKIAGYGGQGPLDRWVAVVAQRQVVTMLRSEASEQQTRERAAVEVAMGASPEAEVVLAKHRYREEFERAMTDALSVLGERDRLLLRLHLVSQTSVESIGKMYGVSQATASRWLARARDEVSTEVTRLLRERLRATPDELASLAGLVASQIEVSISRLLGPGELDRSLRSQAAVAPTPDSGSRSKS